jgi:asparagine synthase (glutamine-hydrolysing)
MCGVLGLIRPIRLDTQASNEFISLGLEAISPRGPDGSAVVHDHCADFEVILAHSRLSIIDLSDHGRQPMQEESSGWSITYNGEIYNYLEIREDLRALGWSFHGQSDTEVLLKAWIQWGLDSLRRLNGMFAFAIFSRKTGEMWLVRDRFGVKPLLWGRSHDGSLGFSSSVAAVARFLHAEVDLEYCARGLRYRAFEVPGSEAPFKGVNAVPPGGWLKIQISSTGLDISDGRWYDLKQGVERTTLLIEACSDEDVLQKCEELLRDAVQVRLRSDVPVAVSLSGGLDSSTIAAIASRHVPLLNGFTYGSPTAAQSEGPVVAEFAQVVGITAQYIWPEHTAAGLDTLLERVLGCQEAPFPGLSVLAQNEVFRIVREAGFKVLLGGQGGDETFAGYRKFFVVAARDALNRHDVVGSLRLLYCLGLMLWHEAGQARTYWHALSRYRNKSAFAFNLLDWAPPDANLWGGASCTLADRQIDDIQQWSVPSLLRYEDRNSMGHGVESRLPFMDYRLVELALALPARLKIAKGYGKWALRHVTDSVVPDVVRLNRKKRGFDVTQSWIEGGIGASLRARIQDHQSALSPYLKRGLHYETLLSDDAFKRNPNLLDEALMLAWLAEPVRLRGYSQRIDA